jgi:hypothetical protein
MQSALQAAEAASDAAQAMAEVRERTASAARDRRPSLSAPFRFMVFLAVNLLSLGAGLVQLPNPIPLVVFGIAGFTGSIVAVRMIHVVAQWERGIVLRLGKFQGVRGPGLVLILPVIEYLRVIDTRVRTLGIPRQRVITRDNVPVSVNGVLYFKVVEPQDAVIKVQDYEYAIREYAQAALRDVIGRLTLDELLAEREQIQHEIEQALTGVAKEWGLVVDAIRLLDIDMPEELKRMMSRQASAEREKRATITKAEGDRLAAFNLAEAAQTMLASPGAMQLRTLQTLDGLGASPSNTIVMAIPSEVFESVSALAKAGAARIALPAAPPADPPPTP